VPDQIHRFYLHAFLPSPNSYISYPLPFPRTVRTHSRCQNMAKPTKTDKKGDKKRKGDDAAESPSKKSKKQVTKEEEDDDDEDDDDDKPAAKADDDDDDDDDEEEEEEAAAAEEEEEEEEAPKKKSAAKADEDEGQGGDNGYTDETIECKDCGTEFIFSAGEQEFYAQKVQQRLCWFVICVVGGMCDPLCACVLRCSSPGF